MSRLIAGTVALSLALFITGCTTEPAPATPAQPAKDQVLIVDLDRVLQSLGKDDEINEEIAAFNQKIAQQMVAIRQSFAKQLEAKQKEFGDEPTEEQKKVLQNMVVEANQKWQQAQNQAVASSQNERSRLRKKFVDQVTIEAKAIANERGAKVVIAKSAGVLWNVDGIDISDAVYKAMLASGAATKISEPTPEPKLEDTSATEATQPSEAAE